MAGRAVWVVVWWLAGRAVWGPVGVAVDSGWSAGNRAVVCVRVLGPVEEIER